MLLGVKGIGEEICGCALVRSAFTGAFANRRQIAAYAGLAATPWQSGSVAHEQGVSKAGNARLRNESWCSWPGCGCAINRGRHWRDGSRGSSARAAVSARTMIVALARKLLVALVEVCRPLACDRRGRRSRAPPRRQARRLVRRATSPTVEQQQHHDQSAETRSVFSPISERTDGLHGFKSRSEEWLRPLEPPAASEILVRHARAADRM